jgi:CheY-like chemotaxis protein
VEAANGRQALGWLGDHPVPAVILLDLMMPEMDGFEVLDTLAADVAWREIPVIVLTAKELTAAERERLLRQANKVIDKGTTSRFDIALAVGEAMRRRSARAAVGANTRANGANWMSKVLLIEDNEMNRDMLSRRLIRRGFEVIFAVDGQQGIDLARSQRPDIILMDMSLPVIDGWEATRRVKSDAATRGVPVIGLTAHAMSGDREKAIEAGCDDYDTKPVEFDRLIGKIERLLGAAKS